jgi:hypothetical protein
VTPAGYSAAEKGSGPQVLPFEVVLEPKLLNGVKGYSGWVASRPPEASHASYMEA